LKERFTTEPVLVTPNLDKEMRVEADMSDFTMGGILLMKCEDKKWRLVVYILEAWKHFLEGAKDYFEIWTDYKNLEYFIKAQKLNQR